MGDKLTAKQEKALVCLLTEPNIRAAAKAAKVGETTIHKWLSDSKFKEAYREARKSALDRAIARLQQAAVSAVETLQEVMTDGEAPHSARVTAAKTVLDTAFKAYELEEITARVEELEKQMGES